MNPTYISAFKGFGINRMYVAINGNIYEHSGGSLAWRNNNPGNMEYSDFTRNNGTIGTDGRFAIFPNENIGWNAMVNLLLQPRYQKLTIDSAIRRYPRMGVSF
jgi:hypothetical protein